MGLTYAYLYFAEVSSIFADMPVLTYIFDTEKKCTEIYDNMR